MAKRTAKSIAQDKNIKAMKAGKRVSESGNVYHENRANRSDKDRRKKFARGGSVDAPTVYVADLNAYNNGKLIGEHIDLSEYSSGSEVMDKIHELTKKWAKASGESEVEYAIHDYEGFPKSFYHESMGEKDFDKVIEFYNTAEDSGIPMDVVEKWVDETGSDVDQISDAYNGSFKDEEDFAYDLVEQLGGMSGISNPEYYLYVSDTDRRLVAGEEYDRMKEDLESEGELSEEEIEERADEVYDEWYEGLNDPYYFLVDEQGIYDGESILKASFVQFDYEKFAKELFMSDYTSIRGKDGDTYVFSTNYAKGGQVKKFKKGGEVNSKTQDEIKKLRAVVNSPNIGENLKAKAQARIDMLEEKVGKSTPAPKSKPMPKAKKAALTSSNIQKALDNRQFYDDKKDSDIIDLAVEKGFVRRPSHTQAEWTDKGAKHFGFDKPKTKKTEAPAPKAKKKGDTIFGYAKRTQKAGESWKDAIKRASKELKNGGKPVAKKIKKAARKAKPVAKKIKKSVTKKTVAKAAPKKIKKSAVKKKAVAKLPRVIKRVKHLNGSTTVKQDKKVRALASGKRMSKAGNVYYEYRANRADLNRTKKLEEGGEI